MIEKLKRQNQQGFTIIEVLIVLAIAGLILLIVFLAVPNLERTSRNTQRKNDASAIASAISNFVSNNGGQLPSKVAGDGTDTNQLVLSSTSSTNTETAKLGYYATAASATAGASTGGVFISTPSSAPTLTVAASGTPSATTITPQSVSIVDGYTCNSSNTGIGSASPRTAAIFYATETGNKPSLQCLEQ